MYEFVSYPSVSVLKIKLLPIIGISLNINILSFLIFEQQNNQTDRKKKIKINRAGSTDTNWNCKENLRFTWCPFTGQSENSRNPLKEFEKELVKSVCGPEAWVVAFPQEVLRTGDGMRRE